MSNELPIRMAHTPAIGKFRGELYRGAMRQLKKAVASEFYIEAVALCESIISDRLESRLSLLNNHSLESRRQRSLHALLKYLISIESPKSYPEITAIYHAIEKWRTKRNRAVHNAVKLSDGESLETWEIRYSEIKAAAFEGRTLANRLIAEVRRLKKLREKEIKQLMDLPN